MKNIFILLCLFCAPLFAFQIKSSSIDVTKEAVTVKYTKSREEANIVTQNLKDFDTYVRLYRQLDEYLYIVYAVNISKNSYKKSLEKIQKNYTDAFQASNSRIKYFVKIENEKETFVFQKKLNEDTIVYQTTSSLNKNYAIAKKYFNEKKYDKALKIFKQLSQNAPTNKAVSFYLGRTYYEMRNYEQASAMFERIVIVDDNHLRAKLELAQTYLKLKMYDESLNGFNEVLKKDIPIGVRKNVEKRVKYIEGLQKKGRFFGVAALGYTIDNNINNVTDIKTFDTPNFEGLSITDKQYSDSYLTLMLNLNYSYRLNNRYTLLNKLNYIKQKYSKDDDRLNDSTSSGITKESKKELELLSYNLKLSKSKGKNRVSLSADFSKIKSATLDYMKIYGSTLTYERKYFNNLLFFSSLKFSKKSYVQDSDKSLDSKNYQLTIGQMTPTKKYGSFNFIYSNTQENRLVYNVNAPNKMTNTLIMANRYKLTDSLTTNLSYIHNHIKEKDLDTTFEVRRDDQSSTLSLGLDYKISATINLTSTVKNIENKSNIDIYSYDKQTIDLFFKKRF